MSATRRIRVLPDVVANQIAAGEVVERPASVVKELVENALDAGATRVDVRIDQGGKRRIRVEDDGHGMLREDALLAFDRHATSKIERAEDLNGIATFGFRGEALPSIGAVSITELMTRSTDHDVGTRIRMRTGTITVVEDAPRRPGTTIVVENLFAAAPARRKFLKATAAETRAVSDVMVELALSHPDVGFTLASGDRVLLDLGRTADLRHRARQIWGDEWADTMMPLSGDCAGYGIVGLLQRPDAVRSARRRAHLFVGGRPFRDASLIRAVERGYRTTVPEGTRPSVVLFMAPPAGAVDVNVHPAKREVRFRDRAGLEAALETWVRERLGEEESAAPYSSETQPSDGPGFSAGPTAASTGAQRSLVREGGAPRSGAASSATDDQMALFVASGSPYSEGPGSEAPRIETPPPRPRLWQALATYIVVETRDGMLIVDQHSAHERVMFEELMGAFERGGQTGQRLLFPLTLRLTPAEMDSVDALKGLLERAGFEVERFASDTVIVHAVPDPHPQFDAERCFRDMIAELTEGSELVNSARNQHERIAKTFACKGSVKAGQVLSRTEMESLLDRLFATELPHHDVHGRPTIVKLSRRELARRFER